VLPLENQKDTLFPMLPLSIPIDYYDADFFNRLPPRLRSRIATQQVAFLPDVSKSFGGYADEKLNDKGFTAKYGEAVCARYDVPDHNISIAKKRPRPSIWWISTTTLMKIWCRMRMKLTVNAVHWLCISHLT
jgi:hypothetical protein